MATHQAGDHHRPLVLGIILGKILDPNLRRSLIISSGGFAPLFTRPICAVVAAPALLTILGRMPWFRRFVGVARAGAKSAAKSVFRVGR